MVTFNLKHGFMVARAAPGQGFRLQLMRGYKMEHVKKPPLAFIQWSSTKDADTRGPYWADSLGNVQCTHPKDIANFQGKGYPIYDGPVNQTMPVTPEQLVWPNTVENVLNPERNPYERRIMAALGVV